MVYIKLIKDNIKFWKVWRGRCYSLLNNSQKMAQKYEEFFKCQMKPQTLQLPAF